VDHTTVSDVIGHVSSASNQKNQNHSHTTWSVAKTVCNHDGLDHRL